MSHAPEQHPTNHTENHAEKGHGAEATAASDNWLGKTKNKLVRLVGHGALTYIGESFWHFGSKYLARIPKLGGDIKRAVSELSVDPVKGQALQHFQKTGELTAINDALTTGFAVTGLAGLALGAYAGGQGIKHASLGEKAFYWGAKASVAASYMFNPSWLWATSGVSAIASLWSQRHRK